MKHGRYLPCANCRAAWVPIAYDAPHAIVLCTNCQPRPQSRLLPAFKRVWWHVRPYIRLPHVTREAVLVALCFAVIGLGVGSLWAVEALVR